MKQNLSSKAFFALSMVIFGTIGLFRAYIPLSSAELAMYRATLALLPVGLGLLLSKSKPTGAQIRKVLPLLILSGAAMGFNWILLFEAYRYTAISTATLSYYFAPVLVMALSPILFREKLTGLQIVCFIGAVVGLVLITGAGSGKQDLIGIAFGLSAAILYASVVLLNKYIRGIEGLSRTFFQFLAAAAVLIPYVLLTQELSVHTLQLPALGHLLVVCLVHTGFAYCVYFQSLRKLPGQEAAILSYLDPLVAVILDVTVMGQPLGPWKLTGGILILGFTLLNELSAEKNFSVFRRKR